MKKIILILGIVVINSCTPSKVDLVKGPNYFGQEILPEHSIQVSEAADSLEGREIIEITLAGVIQEVCQAKGCWMTISDDSEEISVFVQFLDYSFFVPKDASGHESIIKGNLYEHISSAEELRHLAKDKGASPEDIAAITKPKKELRLLAEGVIIYN